MPAPAEGSSRPGGGTPCGRSIGAGGGLLASVNNGGGTAVMPGAEKQRNKCCVRFWVRPTTNLINFMKFAKSLKMLIAINRSVLPNNLLKR